MNVLALTWIDEHLALEQDYRTLWRHYTELQRAYLLLLAQVREERELRSWAAGEIEARWPRGGAA